MTAARSNFMKIAPIIKEIAKHKEIRPILVKKEKGPVKNVANFKKNELEMPIKTEVFADFTIESTLDSILVQTGLCMSPAWTV